MSWSPVRLIRAAVVSCLAMALIDSRVAAQQGLDRSPDDQLGRQQFDAQRSATNSRQRLPTAHEATSPEQTNDPIRREDAGFDRAPGDGLILTDADRVSWLAAQLDDAAALNAYAVERLADSKIQELAKRNAEHLEQQATVVRQAAAQRSHAAWQERRGNAHVTPDLSDTIGEIGDAVRDRLRQRAVSEGGTRSALNDEAGDRESVEIDPTNRRADWNRRNQTELSANANRVERRRAARERLGVLLPAVRRELPEMLEMLADAIEDETADTAAWVGHQTRIADRILEAKKEELARYQPGEQFDQAFLGICLVSAVELRAATEAVAENTDQTLSLILMKTGELLTRQADEARRLMGQQYSSNASFKSSHQDTHAR